MKKFTEHDDKLNEASRYQELDILSDEILKELIPVIINMINAKTEKVKSEMPYKAQFVLEELIRKISEGKLTDKLEPLV